jgi:hypothetical protein
MKVRVEKLFAGQFEDLVDDQTERGGEFYNSWSLRDMAGKAADLGRWGLASRLVTRVAEDEDICIDNPFRELGAMATELGDLDRAREYFELAGEVAYGEREIVEYLITSGNLDGAEDLIKLRLHHFDRVSEAERPVLSPVRIGDVLETRLGEGLRALVDKHVENEAEDRKSAAEILDLVDGIVVEPDETDFGEEPEDKVEALWWKMEKESTERKYNLIIQKIAPLALQQRDFKTAEIVIDRLSDWYASNASGAKDVLDDAYATKDINVRAATLALIYRKWRSGRAPDDLPKFVESLKPEYRQAIRGWLQGTDLADVA